MTSDKSKLGEWNNHTSEKYIYAGSDGNHQSLHNTTPKHASKAKQQPVTTNI
jgi:hypothetical protein